ncbi:MAG: DUF4831 family protein [Candidatus Azobacteroides sp.]|nr:DUF4831 family protein [Candidatus Azobacteroides sp.]
MRKIGFIFLSFICSMVAYGQLEAVKLNVTKGNEYGITYTLPKTSLNVDIKVTKVTRKAGEFYQYAEKYLGIKDIITKDEEYWTLDKVDVWEKGIPDKENSFLLPLKSSNNPYIYLTAEGLLCAINTEPDLTILGESRLSIEEKEKENKRNINTSSVLTEEFLMASSTAKMADIAAKQIYRIRESRLNILTGEADNMPGDGESFKLVISQLDAQEKALTEMFTGTTSNEEQIYTYTLTPDKELNNYIVCRFSKHLGLVDANDLSGTPLFLSLVDITDEVEISNALKDKNKKGIVYNVPGEADITISFSGKTLYNAPISMTQFGTNSVLPAAIFENKKTPAKVVFYPDSGSVKELMQ